MFSLTKLTAETPRVLSKHFELATDGTLTKSTAAALSKGRLTTLSLPTPEALIPVIAALGPADALMFGVPTDPGATRVASRRMLADLAQPGTIARTKTQIAYPEGGAFLFIDCDGVDGDFPDPQQILEWLYRICPALRDVRMIMVASSSSHIHRTSDGEDLTGRRGLHVYVPVKPGTDIPRAAKVLQDRAWCAGLGHIRIARNGVMLARTFFDTAVHQPNRLAFAAGATCGKGLEQRRGAPSLINPGGAPALDTVEALPPLDDTEIALAQAARDHARAANKARADAVREAWLQRGRPALMRSLGARNLPAETAQTLMTAIDEQILEPDFIVMVRPVGETKLRPVAVRDLVADRTCFHRALTLDPVEPDYGDRAEVGILFLDGRKPVLHSMAHGGATYSLRTERREVAIDQAEMGRTTRALVAHMQADGRFYDHGGVLSTVWDGQRMPLDEYALEYMLGETLLCLKTNRRGELVPAAIPPRLLAQLTRPPVVRQMPPLGAVVTHPIITAEGALLDRPGYHPAQRLVLDTDPDAWPQIVAPQTDDEARAQIRAVLHPFRGFPFVTPADRGALYAAVLTALLRASLPTAPAVVVTAPVIGAGKTTALTTVVAIASGEEALVMPPILGRDDAEIGKVLTAMVLQGSPYAIFDNVEGEIHSPTLQSFITAGRYSARPLTTNDLIRGAHTRYFIGLTGTNLSFSPDMQRRILTCRLDPGADHGVSRIFDWCPQEAALAARPQIIAAALGLVLAAQKADLPPARETFGSFPTWERLIRTALRHAEHLTDGWIADPVPRSLQAIASTGETHALHQLHLALLDTFGWDRFTARDLLLAHPGDERTALADALADVTGRAERLSSRSLGRYLAGLLDRPLWGLVLRAIPGQKALVYRLEPHEPGGKDPAEVAFGALAPSIDLPAALFGQVLPRNGRPARIEAIDRSSATAPILARDLETGAQVALSLADVAALAPRAS